MKKHYWLYVLELEGGYYYIGITAKRNPKDRIRQHGRWFGAKWTLHHKPVKVISVSSLGSVSIDEAERSEQSLTLEYVNKHGIDKVRGGNLTYTGKYLKRFGRYHRDSDWEAITVVIFLLLIILVLGWKAMHT